MDAIVPKDYLELRRVMDVNCSPHHVAWVEKKSNPIEKTYVSSIKVLERSTGEFKQFTAGSKMDYYPRFSPDGSHLAFISTRKEDSQIYVMEVDGGEALPLTDTKHGVLGFTWSPSGKSIAFTARVDPNREDGEEEPPITKFEQERRKAHEEEEERKVKDPRVITTLTYRRGTEYDHPDRFSHVFIIDLETKDSRRLSDGYFNHSVPQFISNQEVISVSNREQPRDLGTKVSLVKFEIGDTSEGEIITKVDNTWETDPVASENGLVFVNTFGPGTFAGQTNKWARIEQDRAEIINQELDRSVNMIRIINDKEVLVSVDDRGKTDIRKYNVDTKKFHKLVDEPLSVVDFDATNTEEVYFSATDPQHVWAVWKWDQEEGLELIDDPNAELLKQKRIITPEEFWLRNEDGIEFQGWFFDAGQEKNTKPPLVLSIHGGPHAMWNNAGTMWHEWQCLLSMGYSILAVNPIGSLGYGEEFSQIILAKWGMEDARDLLKAVDQFKDRVDQDRLYVTGGSYAGFQTANLISRDDRFKAACSQRGVYDLVTFGLTTDIPLWATWEWEGTPWDKLEHLWEHSPLGRAEEINTPLLIIHSENDFRVAISQAEELFAALKLKDKEAVLVRYPRDGHELSRSGEPLHVVDRIERMIDWFETHK